MSLAAITEELLESNNDLLEVQLDIATSMDTVVEKLTEVCDILYDQFEFFKKKEKRKQRESDVDEQEDLEDDRETDSRPKKMGSFASGFKEGKESELGPIKMIKEIFTGLMTSIGFFAGRVAKFILPVIKLMTVVGGVLIKVGKVLLKLLPRLALPLTIIVGLFSGITKAIEDFTNQEGSLTDKLIAGWGGFVKGISRIITMPLDLLKDAVSWIAGKLGFDQFSEMLDSFSFVEMFDELQDSIVEMLIGIKDWIVENLSPDAVVANLSAVGDQFNEWLKSLARAVLPDPDSWKANLIPDAVYEWANAPPPEVKELPKQKEEPTASTGDIKTAASTGIEAAASTGGTGAAASTGGTDAKKEQKIIQEMKSGKTAGEAIQAVSPSPVKMSPKDFVKQQQEQFKKNVASGKVKPTKSGKPKPVKVKKTSDDFFKEQELDEKIGALQAEQREISAQKETIIQEMLSKGMRVPADSRDPDYPFAELDKRQAEIRAELKTARGELDKFKKSKGPDKFDAALEDSSSFDAALEDSSSFDAALEDSSSFDAALEGKSTDVPTKTTRTVAESGGGSTTKFASKRVGTDESKALTAEADKMQADLDAKLEGMDDDAAFDYLMTDEGAAASNAIKQKRAAANAAMTSVSRADEVIPSMERTKTTSNLNQVSSENSGLKAASASPTVVAPNNSSVSNSNVTNNISQLPTSPVDKFDRNVSAFG